MRVSAANGFTNTEVTRVVAGYNHTCAVEGGAVWCWGDGAFGKLGNGATSQALEPVKVVANGGFLNDGANGGVSALSAGLSSTCAIENFAAFCWGNNAQGQLGDGSGSSSNKPVAVSDLSGSLSNMTHLSVGSYSACAIASDTSASPTVSGATYCWGFNDQKQIGDDTITDRPEPTVVNAFPGPVANELIYAVEVGGKHACAIKTFKLYCWGDGQYGQLGDGTTADGGPVAVDDSLFSGEDADVVSAGGEHTCAIAGGRLYCWGKNVDRQLGDGSQTNSSSPVLVAASTDPGFTNTGTMLGVVSDVSAGAQHTCAIENSVVSCWGKGMYGRLGTGDSQDQTKPVKVFVVSAPEAPSNVSVMAGPESLSLTVTQPNDGGSTITAYEYSIDEGAPVSVARPADRNGTFFTFAIESLTAGTEYSIRVRAVNSVGAGPLSAAVTGTPMSSGGGGSEAAATDLDRPAVSASMTEGVISVVFTGLAQSDVEGVYVKVMPMSAAFASSMEDSFEPHAFVANPTEANEALLPVVADGSLTVTMTQLMNLVVADDEEVISPVDFDAAGSYHLSYYIEGAASSEYPNGWQIDYYEPLYADEVAPIVVAIAAASDDSASDSDDSTSDDAASDSDDTTSDDAASDSDESTSSSVPGGVVAPGDGVVSELVTESNASTFVRSPGEVSLVDGDGNPVIGELVRVSDEVGSVPAASRTPEQVAQIRSEAVALVEALSSRAPEGSDVPVQVVETETGANLSGLVTDPADGTSDLPVPVEDVVLLVTDEQALLLGGADGPADPADLRGGVLELGPDGEVSAVAYGLTPGASGELVVMSSPTLMGTFIVGADGSFQGQAALPSTLAAGSHTVVLAVDGLVASAGVVVTGEVALPVTGSGSSSVPWAVLVVAAGALAVLVIRRRVVV